MKKTEQSRMTYNKKAANYDNTYDGRVTRPLKHDLLEVAAVECGNMETALREVSVEDEPNPAKINWNC